MSDALTFDTLAWLAALPAPFALAWWLSRSAGARREATGALELWLEIERAAPRGARRSWAWPARTWFVVAALVCGIAALAGPALRRRGAPTAWRVVVDAGPAMGLRDGGESPRGARAVERAQRLLATVVAPGDTLEWLWVSGDVVLERASAPSERWWSPQAARLGRARPAWPRFDEPGVLWVTERGAGLAPRWAGVCATWSSAGEAPVAAWPGRVLWKTAGSTLERAAERAPRVRLAQRNRTSAIGRAVEAWARARGVEVVEGAQEDSVELVLELAPRGASEGASEGASSRAASGSRDGWRLRGSAAPLKPAAPLDEPWLLDDEDPTLVLVRAARGRVECALGSDHQLDGDAVAFAVAWAELLDRMLLPVSPTAPWDALGAPEEAVERAPRRPPSARADERPLGSALALAAASFALLAAFHRR